MDIVHGTKVRDGGLTFIAEGLTKTAMKKFGYFLKSYFGVRMDVGFSTVSLYLSSWG
jgi:hypothetical protein